MLSSSNISGFYDGIRPPPRLHVSDWADRYRYLSPVASAEPGRWSTARTPYLREPMNRLSDFEDYEWIIVVKGAQLGFTEMGNNWLGYVMSINPGPTMAISPTEGMAKRNSKIRIAPMIKSTPLLATKVVSSEKRSGGNTVLSKSFPGGVLIMAGASSGSELRSMPAKNLFLDEVDAYPIDVDGEGSPIELAAARTRTFSKSKKLMVSTPVVKGESPSENGYLDTAQRKYFLPCPHCGHMQHLRIECLQWDKGKPETVLYYCEDCGAGFEERHKVNMYENDLGKWRDTNLNYTGNPRKVGYHINSLYSPYGWFSWVDIARMWEDSENDEPKRKVFTNTVLGETYDVKGDAPDWQALYNRRENYEFNHVPADVAFITCGVDVQKDRLELELVGWCEGKRTYSIDYRVIQGETTDIKTWNLLANVVGEMWTRADGIQLPLKLMAVDSGYNTSHVYEFAKRFDHTRVIPVKGRDNLSVVISTPRSVDTSRSGKAIGRVKVWSVGTDLCKSELYGWLRVQADITDGVESFPPGFCHFPQYDQEFFRGITAEELRMKINRGYRAYAWVKKYERNEPIDCRIYARAAAAIVGMDRFNSTQWNELRNSYEVSANKPKQTKKRKDSFWN